MTHMRFGVALFLGLGLSSASLVGCQPRSPDPQGLSTAQRAALEAVPGIRVGGSEASDPDSATSGPDPDVAIPLAIDEPRDGAVIPFGFPSLYLRWQDGRRANAFRLRFLATDGRLLLERVARERVLILDGADWSALKTAVGPGGDFVWELVAGSWLPDGRALRPPATVRVALRLAAAAEEPTGQVLYGKKERPARRGPGPVHVDLKSVILTGVRFQPFGVETVAERMPGEPSPEAGPQAQPGPFSKPSPGAPASVDFSGQTHEKGVPVHADLEHAADRTCVSCHTASADGRYLAVASQDDVLVPRGWDSSQGVLFVLRRKDRSVAKVLPSGVLPRFHPTETGKMVYSATGASFSVKQRVSIYMADLVVVDVEAEAAPRPIPGASDPDYCELFGEWSPDGQTVAFSRSQKGRPCMGSRSHLDIVTVPYRDGVGGEPIRLPGASANGRSNVQPRYSPDGQWLLFFEADRGWFARGATDLYVVPAQGGPARALSVNTRALESWHAFSPDGRWLAFVSNRDRVDRPWIYVARFLEDGTTRAAVALPGASGPGAHAHTMEWGP